MRTLRRMLKLASLPPAVVLATLVAAGCQSGATTSVATTTAMPTGTPTSTLATALSGTFSPTGSMTSPRLGQTATLLPSGKVLIAGGRTGDSTDSLASAELYDPASGTFRPTGSMSSTRAWHTATLLTNGEVLIAGGTTGLVLPGAPLASAELYDPATGKFSPTGSMATARTAQTETRLKDGRVLIAAGCSDQNRPVSSVELFDPGSGSFSSTGALSTIRSGASATLLADGKGPGRRGRTTAQLRRLVFVGVGGAVYAITEGFAASTPLPAQIQEGGQLERLREHRKPDRNCRCGVVRFRS